MFKILSAGTSVTDGLGLHLYERHKNGLPLNYILTSEERKFNFDNSYHSILARKLNTISEIYSKTEFGLDTPFDDMLHGIKLEINKEQTIPVKIVIIQLSNIENEDFQLNFDYIDKYRTEIIPLFVDKLKANTFTGPTQLDQNGK